MLICFTVRYPNFLFLYKKLFEYLWISFFQRLDYETAVDHRYNIQVKATNVGDSPVPLSDICDVIIRVQNADEAPEFEQSSYEFHGMENNVNFTFNFFNESKDK